MHHEAAFTHFTSCDDNLILSGGCLIFSIENPLTQRGSVSIVVHIIYFWEHVVYCHTHFLYYSIACLEWNGLKFDPKLIKMHIILANYLSPGQTDSQVDTSFGLAFNLHFVWPPLRRLASTCDDLHRLALTLVEFKFGRK